VKWPVIDRDVREMPVSVLAYIGDAVYELYVRMHSCRSCLGKSGQLHRRSVSLVRAKAQAQAVQKLLPMLGEDELSIYRRGATASLPAAHGTQIRRITRWRPAWRP
jgi:ribonuclease-3 family protein